jgi:hypothetical protein
VSVGTVGHLLGTAQKISKVWCKKITYVNLKKLQNVNEMVWSVTRITVDSGRTKHKGV